MTPEVIDSVVASVDRTLAEIHAVIGAIVEDIDADRPDIARFKANYILPAHVSLLNDCVRFMVRKGK